MRSALKLSFPIFTLTGILASGALASTQDPPQPPPDNTKVNERDKKPSEPTADQQHNDQTDKEITQRIRRSVMKDKSLSAYAHNVKIISQDGKVTLKGPVRSEAEKRTIEAKAAEVVGHDKVISELAVAPKQ
jgi:hyperosmotically inducible periplasmic protein